MKRRDLFRLLAGAPAAWCVSKLGLEHVEGFFPPEHASRWVVGVDFGFPSKITATLIEALPDGTMVLHDIYEGGGPIALRLPSRVYFSDLEFASEEKDAMKIVKMLPPARPQ